MCSGETFFYWYGIHSRLYVAELELIKEVLSNKFGYYEKQTPRPLIIALFGWGLAFINGLRWVKRRRIVSPAFNIHKLKVWILRMSYNDCDGINGLAVMKWSRISIMTTKIESSDGLFK